MVSIPATELGILTENMLAPWPLDLLPIYWSSLSAHSLAWFCGHSCKGEVMRGPWPLLGPGTLLWGPEQLYLWNE